MWIVKVASAVACGNTIVVKVGLPAGLLSDCNIAYDHCHHNSALLSAAG